MQIYHSVDEGMFIQSFFKLVICMDFCHVSWRTTLLWLFRVSQSLKFSLDLVRLWHGNIDPLHTKLWSTQLVGFHKDRDLVYSNNFAKLIGYSVVLLSGWLQITPLLNHDYVFQQLSVMLLTHAGAFLQTLLSMELLLQQYCILP